MSGSDTWSCTEKDCKEKITDPSKDVRYMRARRHLKDVHGKAEGGPGVPASSVSPYTHRSHGKRSRSGDGWFGDLLDTLLGD
jgi:hypothetical protein